jgi:hypothetical protein
VPSINLTASESVSDLGREGVWNGSKRPRDGAEAAVGVIGASLVMSHGETSVALFGVVRINLPRGLHCVCVCVCRSHVAFSVMPNAYGLSA